MGQGEEGQDAQGEARMAVIYKFARDVQNASEGCITDRDKRALEKTKTEGGEVGLELRT